MEPLLFVIAINYNTAAHTIEMVDSVRNSDYPNLQVVVVDNCSSEEDYRQLQQISDRATVIRTDENIGFSGGNNVGLQYAIKNGAEYAMLLNNDTTIEPGSITAMVQCLQSGEADVVCPKIIYYYNRDTIAYAGGELVDYKGAVRIYGFQEQQAEQYDRKRQITFASGCCTMMRMETWREIGLMEDKYFLYFEDTALSAKIVKAGKKMMYVPQAVVYHKESVSTQALSDNYQYYFCRNRLLYIKENIPFPMKAVAYGYTGLYMLKKMLQRRFAFRNVKDAVSAFVHARFGKRAQ